jgi:hypothetical protein
MINIGGVVLYHFIKNGWAWGRKQPCAKSSPYKMTRGYSKSNKTKKSSAWRGWQ